MKCKTLDVWKLACSLSSDIYLLMKACRDFGFKDQITRSGLSVASNIAEGIEWESDKESWRFLDIAQASLAESKTQVYIGMKIEYIDHGVGREWLKRIDRLHVMIKSFKKGFTTCD